MKQNMAPSALIKPCGSCGAETHEGCADSCPASEYARASGAVVTMVMTVADYMERLSDRGDARTAARIELDHATDRLRAMVLKAAEDGVPETVIAKAAKVDRMTVRKWRTR